MVVTVIGSPGVRSRAPESWLVRSAVSSLVAAALIPTAQAQETDAAAAEEVSEVTITGSRIVRRDFTSDSPLATVSEEALQNTSEIGVEQALNRMPQFVPGQNQFSHAISITVTPRTTPGIATANLRGLDANRTLVLLDGRRTQPANASMVVDLNTIPSAAIESIEVITGGAGSTYGADAVAGVVNFKLKRNYQGITLEAQTGQTEHGDGNQRSATALIGANFGEDRGNAMIGMSFAKRDAIIREDRDFFSALLNEPLSTATQFPNFAGFVANAPGNITNSPAGGAPSQAAVNSVFGAKGFVAGDVASNNSFWFNKAATVDQASLFVTPQGRLSGTLSPGYLGDVFPNDPRAKYVQSNALTGAQTLTTNNIGAYLQVPLTRYSLFTNLHYDVTDRVTAYMQASFDENKTRTLTGDFAPAGNQWGVTVPHGSGLYAPSLNTNGTTRAEYQAGGIYGLNCPATGGCTNSQAFPVPAELAELLASRGATANSPWTLNQQLNFMPVRSLNNTAQTYELVAGVRGELGFRDWTYDFFAARGNTNTSTEYQGFTDAAAYQALMNSPNYGRGASYNNGRLGLLASCTSGLNPFLNTGVSEDCLEILDSNAKLTSQLSQVQAELNIQGALFPVPAGEMRFAFGTAYRKNTYEYLPDHGMQTANIVSVVLGQFDTTETRGEIAVKEVYGELLAPVLRDKFLVKSLELNAGYRFSEYDTVAGGVNTWKLTANWDLNDFVKIRGGRQIANRAPNIAELYQPPVFEIVPWADHDPCSNLTRANFGNVATNPNRADVQALCSQLAGGFPIGDNFVGNNAVYFNVGRDLTAGNANLDSEEAKTWTAGVVLNSPFESDALRNATLSFDYYEIDIDGAISTATTSYAYQVCFNAFGTNPDYDASNPFCQRIIRDPNNGFWVATRAQFLNLASRTTSGIDATLDYRLNTPFFGGQTGTFFMNVSANWLDSYKVQVASDLPVDDYKDSIGSTLYGAQYRWKTTTNVGYSFGPASVSIMWRHLPSVRNQALVTDPRQTIEPTPNYDIFNLTARWSVTDALSIRAGVDNLLDAEPPRVGANYVPTSTGGGVTAAAGTTDLSNYDVAGRRYYIGATARF